MLYFYLVRTGAFLTSVRKCKMTYDEFLDKINKLINSKKLAFDEFKENERRKQEIKKGKDSGNYIEPEKIDDVNDEFLKIGEFLYQADNELNTTEFKKLKDFVLENISNTKSSANLNKVIKIAKHEKMQEYKDKLPKGWGTLAIISQLKNNEFEKFITNPKVTTNTPRSVISQIVKKCQGKEVIESITLTFDAKAENKTSRADVLSLLNKLDLKNKGWKIRGQE